MKLNRIILGIPTCMFLTGLVLISQTSRTQAKPETIIVVTTANDTIATDGQCALREAIIAANTDSAFNDCVAGSGADTVSFDGSLPVPTVFNLTLSGINEDLSMSGDLDIVGNLTITGTGPNAIIIDGNGVDRVLDIRPGANVTISGVTVRNGNPVGSVEGGGIRVLASLTMSNSVVTGNMAGGIFNNGGGMVLTAVTVSNNSGRPGVQNLNQAVLTFNGGEVSGNTSGGIVNATSTASLTNLLVSSNGGSGGVANSGGTLSHLTLSQSTVIGNTAVNGGGIFNSGVGAITGIANTMITNNTASATGGGIYNNGTMSINSSTLANNQANSGGGIDHSGTSLQITNATISGNEASDNGGGLYNRGSATLTHVTLDSNTANGTGTGGNIFNDEALLTLQNSLVAHSPADGNCFNSSGFITSSGNNLEDGNTCAFINAGDQVNTNPLLGPLQDNGGPTLTQALLAGSPAIGQGNDSYCTAVDQRGFFRPATGCDIGAYEAVDAEDMTYFFYLPIVVGGSDSPVLPLGNGQRESPGNRKLFSGHKVWTS
jgi:CSLREA domain-containing protein